MISMLFSHRKVARALIGAGSACALIVAGAFVPLRDAVADDAITGQDYVSYYHLDQVKPLHLSLPEHQLLTKVSASLILLLKH